MKASVFLCNSKIEKVLVTLYSDASPTIVGLLHKLGFSKDYRRSNAECLSIARPPLNIQGLLLDLVDTVPKDFDLLTICLQTIDSYIIHTWCVVNITSETTAINYKNTCVDRESLRKISSFDKTDICYT